MLHLVQGTGVLPLLGGPVSVAARGGGPAERVAAHLRDLHPYVPGKPASDVARELGLEQVVKLASNENPLGPSPLALAAVAREAGELHRYPDGNATELRAGLASRFGVESHRILLGNGSNEILTLLGRALLGPGDEAIMSEGAFVVYQLAAQANGATRIAVPARDFGHDLDAMAEALTEKTRVVFLANPNNPTGTMFGREAWSRFLARVPEDVVVVCDNAYAEYVVDPDYPDVLLDLDAHPQLVGVRTFSKIHGLAGFRIGYGVGPSWLVDLIDRLRDPFNVNHLAQVAALAALDDQTHIQASREVNRAGMAFFERLCRGLGLAFVPSYGNFVLMEVGDAAGVFEALLRVGVIVRPMGAYGFPGHVRVSVGLPEENTAFAQGLAALLGRSGSATAGLVQAPLEEGSSS